jgi:hypothetical protein
MSPPAPAATIHHPAPLLIIQCGVHPGEPRQLRQLRGYRAGELVGVKGPAYHRERGGGREKRGREGGRERERERESAQ